MKNLLKLLTICVLCIFLNLHKTHAQTVYVTENGKKYHAKNCSLAPKGKKGLNLKEAIANGYKPCTRCKIEDTKPAATEPKKTKTKPKTN